MLINFNENHPLAIDYIIKVDVIAMDDKNAYYRNNKINNLWILDNTNKRIYKSERDMDLVKRIIINETKNGLLIFLDINLKKVSLLKTITYPSGNSCIYSYDYDLSELKVTQEGIVESDFDEKFQKYVAAQERKLLFNKEKSNINALKTTTNNNENSNKYPLETIINNYENSNRNPLKTTFVNYENSNLGDFNFEIVFNELRYYKISFENACKLLSYIKSGKHLCEEQKTLNELCKSITRTMGRTPVSDLRNVLVDIEAKLNSILGY